MKLEDIVNRFKGVKVIGEKSFQVLCPCHTDKQPSLTISEDNGKILVYDHARL